MKSLQLVSCPSIGYSRPPALRCSGSRSELFSIFPRTVAKKRACCKHQCTVGSKEANLGSASVGLRYLVSQMGSESSKIEPRVVEFAGENMVLQNVDSQPSIDVSQIDPVGSDPLADCRQGTPPTVVAPQSRLLSRQSGTEKREGPRLDTDEPSTADASYDNANSVSSREEMLWARARHRRERRRQAVGASSDTRKISRELESLKVDMRRMRLASKRSSLAEGSLNFQDGSSGTPVVGVRGEAEGHDVGDHMEESSVRRSESHPECAFPDTHSATERMHTARVGDEGMFEPLLFRTGEAAAQAGCGDGGAAEGVPSKWSNRSHWKQWAGGVVVGVLFFAVSLVAARGLGNRKEPQVVGAYAQLLDRHMVADEKPQDLPPLLQIAEAGVMELEESEFHAVLRRRPTFVMWYAPWCVYCESITNLQTLETLAEELEARNLNVQVAQVDAHRFRSLAEGYEVPGFPTLMLFQGQEPIGSHRGPRDVQSLLNFVDRTLPGK